MTLHHLRANAVAYLALIVALTTGTAYAADLANGSVTTKKLAKNAVTSKKIKDQTITSADVRDQSVTSADILDQSVTSADILDQTVTGADVLDGSLTSVDLQSGLVPGDGTVFGDSFTNATPPQVADSPDTDDRDFTLEAPGSVYLRYAASDFGLTCSNGAAPSVGLRLDDTVVPATKLTAPLANATRAFELVGVVESVASGAHTAALSVDCEPGTWTNSTRVGVTWTVISAAE